MTAKSFTEAFTAAAELSIESVEARHYEVKWWCGDDGVPNLDDPLPSFCGFCTDEEYVGAIEYGDTIDEGASVVFWPCEPLQLARQRDSAIGVAVTLEGQTAEIEAVLHLNDDEPINPPEVVGGWLDPYLDGWDAAIDHVQALVRAALSGGESE